VTVNCSYCTPDDGRGERPKHVEWSCNKTKILLLHLVGYLCTYVENGTRNHEPKKKICPVFVYSGGWTVCVVQFGHVLAGPVASRHVADTWRHICSTSVQMRFAVKSEKSNEISFFEVFEFDRRKRCLICFTAYGKNVWVIQGNTKPHSIYAIIFF
jgi:hypothetical protein